MTFKCDLPNYGVFDEKRVFEPGPAPEVFRLQGREARRADLRGHLAPRVCDDLKAKGAEMLLVPNGSPYRRTADDERLGVAQARVAETGLPTGLRQPGRRPGRAGVRRRLLRLSRDGEVVHAPADVRGGRRALGLGAPGRRAGSASTRPWRTWPDRRGGDVPGHGPGPARLCGKVRAFPGVLLGLSGGIDSAITAVVAADALGPESVRCVMLPSQYTSRESLEDAADCAAASGRAPATRSPSQPAVDAFAQMLTPLFDGTPAGPDRGEHPGPHPRPVA